MFQLCGRICLMCLHCIADFLVFLKILVGLQTAITCIPTASLSYSKPNIITFACIGNNFTLQHVTLLDCLTITGLDWTYYAHHFIFSFTF